MSTADSCLIGPSGDISPMTFTANTSIRKRMTAQLVKVARLRDGHSRHCRHRGRLCRSECSRFDFICLYIWRSGHLLSDARFAVLEENHSHSRVLEHLARRHLSAALDWLRRTLWVSRVLYRLVRVFASPCDYIAT